MSDDPAKAALGKDNPEPPSGEKGEKGLGTEAGVTEPGDENVLDAMPDHRGELKYPDVEDPDADRPNLAPQEGHIEEDPKTVRDASSGAKD